MIATMSAQNRKKVSHVMTMYITSLRRGRQKRYLHSSFGRGSNRRRLGNSYGILSDPSSIIADVWGFVNIF